MLARLRAASNMRFVEIKYQAIDSQSAVINKQQVIKRTQIKAKLLVSYRLNKTDAVPMRNDIYLFQCLNRSKAW